MIYAAPPIVKEMRLSSPAALLLQMPPELLYLMSGPIIGGLYLLPKIADIRKSWHEGTNTKKLGKLIPKAEHKLDLEIRIKEIELQAREREDELSQEISARVRQQIRKSTITDEHLRAIIDAHALPTLRAIEQSDIREIDIAGDASDGLDSGNTDKGSNQT